jgi:hypothetical protein
VELSPLLADSDWRGPLQRASGMPVPSTWLESFWLPALLRIDPQKQPQGDQYRTIFKGLADAVK